MSFNVGFSEHCGLSPQAVAQLAAHVTRGSFVVSVLVLICFFSQTENLTRCSSGACFHSVLLSQRQEKKAADLSCILYIMSSFSECQWLKVLDRLFWFLSHCVRAAQSWSVRSCFLCVRAATFTLTVFSCSTELRWESYMTTCFLMKSFPGIQSSQSHSCNHTICVCVEQCVQLLSGMLIACVEGKSDIRHVPVSLAVYCNLHKDELDNISQQEYFL